MGTRQSDTDKLLHDILLQKICYCDILLQRQFVTRQIVTRTFVTRVTKRQIVTRQFVTETVCYM